MSNNGQFNPNDPLQRETRERFREAFGKVMQAKWKHKEADELVQKAMGLTQQVFELAMQVVNQDAIKGGRFDERSCASLVEKLYIDNLHTWNKDELLFMLVLLQSAFTMERVKEMVDMGLTGEDKSGLL